MQLRPQGETDRVRVQEDALGHDGVLLDELGQVEEPGSCEHGEDGGAAERQCE